MINIVIVDDHKLIIEGICQLLSFSNEINVVAQYDNALDFLDGYKADNPDVICLDINLPDFDGINVIQRLRKKDKRSKILVLTVHNEVEYVEKAINSGANGYILKDAGIEELKQAIITVNDGEQYIQQKLVPGLNNYLIRKEKNSNAVDLLTRRELEILKILAIGGTNKDIAETLGISERTVKNHIFSIFKKIDVTDRTQAAVFAIKNNIVSI